jgi:hypothetical protein
MKIALVQFYQYHEEILAPQINFLLPEHEIFLAAPQVIFKNDYILTFDRYIKKIVFNNNKYNKKIFGVPLRIISIVVKYIQLFSSVKKNGIEMIVFNTINKPFHFPFIKILFNKTKNIHIIHNAQLFKTEKSIRPLLFFKKNLFISFDVYNYFINNHTKNIDKSIFNWFFPCLNDFVPHGYDNNPGILSEDKINIVIPGSVDDDRRNYNGLIRALDNIKDKELPFQIIFLGKISPKKRQLIEDKNLNHIIKTFAGYIPGTLMLFLMKNSDAAAFLVDKTINFQLYNTYKATGTSILCLSFGIPCIVSDDFILDVGLQNKAVIYPKDHIESVFERMINGDLTKAYFKRLKDTPVSQEYSPQFQRIHYKKIIESAL